METVLQTGGVGGGAVVAPGCFWCLVLMPAPPPGGPVPDFGPGARGEGAEGEAAPGAERPAAPRGGGRPRGGRSAEGLPAEPPGAAAHLPAARRLHGGGR